MASVALLMVHAIVLLIVLVSLHHTVALEVRDSNYDTPLKVCAFNVQTFGRSKVSHDEVMTPLTRIMARYDIVLIQEVRDSTGSAQRKLWSLLNDTASWGMVQSAREGRTNYKEQYVFFYKTDSVEIVDSYRYPDTEKDDYEREPFAVELEYYSLTHKAIRRVALLGLHTKPRDTPRELELLSDVIKSVANHFVDADGVVALGDFNADCSYLSDKKESSLDIFKENSGFTSLIPDDADSTVANTDCAYDRVIVYGTDITAKNAAVYDYKSDMDVNTAMAKRISDHYPIEFELH